MDTNALGRKKCLRNWWPNTWEKDYANRIRRYERKRKPNQRGKKISNRDLKGSDDQNDMITHRRALQCNDNKQNSQIEYVREQIEYVREQIEYDRTEIN